MIPPRSAVIFDFAERTVLQNRIAHPFSLGLIAHQLTDGDRTLEPRRLGIPFYCQMMMWRNIRDRLCNPRDPRNR